MDANASSTVNILPTGNGYNLFNGSKAEEVVPSRKCSQSSPLEYGFNLQAAVIADIGDRESVTLMADHNGATGGTPLDSPPQRSGSRAPGSGANSTRGSSAGFGAPGSGWGGSGGGGTASGRLDSGASSPLLQTDALPDEDDASLCPYCHKSFRKPRVLDCLHSMCEDCIIAQLDGRRDAAKARELEKRMTTDCVLEERVRTDRPTPPGVIRCPVCAQECHVGNDIRFVHSMLIDYVRASESGDTRVDRNCRACKSEQAAVAYCRQCGADLCPNCLLAHREMRMFDGHETLSYEELEALGRAGDARRVLCSQHGQPYLVLCATCEALACRHCLDSDHVQPGHKMVDLTPVVVKAIADELVQLSQTVRNKWNKALDAWHAEPDRSASLMLQYETAKGTIDAAYEEAARVLEKSKQMKMKELEEARDRQEAIIDDLYRKVDATQTKIDDAVRFTHRLLESANGVELLASRKKVIHQLRSLEHTMPSLHTECELRFAPVMRKTLEDRLRNAVGEVLSQSLPPSVSAIGDPPMSNRISAAESEWAMNGGGGLGAPGASLVNGGGATDRTSLMVSAPQPPSVTALPPAVVMAPIGGERAARKAQHGAGILTPVNPAAVNAFSGGWPPCSNPPELPSPSPPKDAAPPVSSAATTVVGAPPIASSSASAAAAAMMAAGVSGGPQALAPWAAAAALAAAPGGAADPRIAALLAGYNGGAPGNALKLQNLQMAFMMQQQQQIQRQMGVAADAHLIQQIVAGAAAGNDQQRLLAAAAAASGLGKNVHEIKLAFAHGTGTAGSSLRELHSPGGFAVADNDEILIADTNNHRIVVITPTMPWKFGRPGQEDGQLCFPRRVVAMRGGEQQRYVVIDKAMDNKSRAQLFGNTGEFIRRINLTAVVPKGGIEVWAATSTPSGNLVMVDQSSVIYTLDIKEAQPRVVNWCDASNHLMEASDVAVHEKCIYVTDFRGHGVHVFSHEGQYLRKIGEPSHTPFPIGIDVARSGELLVAHTHGNKLTIVCYSAEGQLQHQFVNCDFRMSRCAALRCTSSGHVVTLSKHAHTLYGFRRIMAPRT